MPKRKRDESEEEKWRRRIKKYEAKLSEKQNKAVKRVVYSSEDEHSVIENYLEYERGASRESGDSGVHHNDYMYSDQIEDKMETDSAILPDPACHVIRCAADVHVDAEVPTPNNTDKQIDSVPAETSTNEEVATEDFNPELLQALGEFETDSIEWGPSVHEDIAKHFQHILLNGLKKEAKEELNKKYLFPKNVPLTKAPTLNPEIAAMLTDSSRNRDKRIHAKQEQIGKGLSGLGKAMTTLLKKDPNIADAMRTLSDVGKLVADAHFAETETRRSVVIPLVEKSLIDPFKDRKRDCFLFGEKLGELVKSSRGIKKTGQLIQAATPTPAVAANLNWKTPSFRPRLQRGGQLPYPSRGGGHRGYSYYQARRRAPPAQNVASRRQTQVPPPPRRQAAQAARPPVNQPQT